MLDATRHRHRRTWLALVVRGFLALAVGIFILACPLDSFGAFTLCIAIWAVLSGVTEIDHALKTQSIFGSWWILLLGGFSSIVFGMAAVFDYPDLSLEFMAIWVGQLLATSGAVVIYSSIQMKDAGLSWGWVCIGGVASLLASVISLINPPATLATMLELLAVFSMLCGTALLVAGWHIRAFTKHLTAILYPSSSGS